MAKINKRELNYRIDFTTMTLIMTADFANQAYIPTTEEYKILTRLQKDFPGLNIVRKTHRTPTKYTTKQGEEYTHNQFKDLSYDRMEKFISVLPQSKTYLAEYEVVKAFACAAKHNGYPIVRKWFVAQFPHFRKNPLFYLNNSPLVLHGNKFIADLPTEDEEDAA